MSLAIRRVILLTVDALRQDEVGCCGAQKSSTPALDRLAASGARFTQAVTVGGWTRPSLTGMLTSTYPAMYGGSWGGLSYNRPYLPEVLQQNGVRTAAIIANPQIGALYGFNRGFDHFEEPLPDYRGPRWAYLHGMQRLLSTPLPHALLGPLQVNTAPPAITATAAELVDRLLEVVRASTEQTFAWVHLMDIHWPYHVSQELRGAREKAQAWRDLRVMYTVSEQQGYYYPGDRPLEEVRAAYRRAVRYTDGQINRLLIALEKSGDLDSTAVIITADHGEEFFEHRRWSHYQLYDENIRVPLILKAPGINPGTAVHRQVSLLDLAPTVLDLMGIDVPGEMLGQSWQSLLQHPESYIGRTEDYIESMWPDTYRLAIRDEAYKFMYDSQLPEERRLYDLRKDPLENENVWSEAPEQAKRFEGLLAMQQARNLATSQGIQADDLSLDQEMVERLRALGYME